MTASLVDFGKLFEEVVRPTCSRLMCPFPADKSTCPAALTASSKAALDLPHRGSTLRAPQSGPSWRPVFGTALRGRIENQAASLCTNTQLDTKPQPCRSLPSSPNIARNIPADKSVLVEVDVRQFLDLATFA